MATCKDCLHFEICRERRYTDHWDINLDKENAEKECGTFKDRSRFVELPCVADEYVYVIEPIFGDSIEHTINRRKIKSIEPNAEIKFYDGWIHDSISGFGRYIFSTYEEAEQALAKQNQPDNSPQ